MVFGNLVYGVRALQLEEFGVAGSDAENVCYLRDLADATRLVDVMQSCTGGNAVLIGGGYIGMECAASLVINKINLIQIEEELGEIAVYAGEEWRQL
uniref:FAD/NAD(P)-binding domain-containing protein n=1 Tax=Vitis vinifera TaxID=29760 RepID=F6H2D3_VITVI